MILEAPLNTTIEAVRFEKPSTHDFYYEMIEDGMFGTDGFMMFDANPKFFLDERDTSFAWVVNNRKKENSRFNSSPVTAFLHLIAKKWFEGNHIKSQVISLQKDGNVEKTLDYIFDAIDDLLIDKRFDSINNFFDFLEVEELDVNTIIGILTITSNWKANLPSRSFFYQRVYEFINKMYLTEETNKILRGLE